MEDFDDEIYDEICDCPKCGRTYDDADADFLICSKCGWNVEKQKRTYNTGNRSISRYGIDPDVKLDDWEK